MDRTVPVLDLRNVSRTYRQGRIRVAALSGVNLSVDGGEFLVLAGSSGSGKSTLLHLMAGLDRPDAGQILFDGVDFASATEADQTRIRWHKLGFVFQSFNLVPVLTAYENVEYGLWLAGTPKADRQRRVERALTEVGLRFLRYSPPAESAR